MRLPNNEECKRIIEELDGDPGLSAWEDEFVRSNRYRTTFSDAQREVIARFMDKYEV